jgi:hypothetical protein
MFVAFTAGVRGCWKTSPTNITASAVLMLIACKLASQSFQLVLSETFLWNGLFLRKIDLFIYSIRAYYWYFYYLFTAVGSQMWFLLIKIRHCELYLYNILKGMYNSYCISINDDLF